MDLGCGVDLNAVDRLQREGRLFAIVSGRNALCSIKLTTPQE